MTEITWTEEDRVEDWIYGTLLQVLAVTAIGLVLGLLLEIWADRRAGVDNTAIRALFWEMIGYSLWC